MQGFQCWDPLWTCTGVCARLPVWQCHAGGGCGLAAQSCPAVQPHRLQLARLPCPPPSPRLCSNSCPLSRWCHPTISSSVVPFSSCLLSFPASWSSPISQFFASGGQSIRASASAPVLPMNIQDWSPLGWTGWISLLKTQESSPAPQFKSINSLVFSLRYGPTLKSIHDQWKNHAAAAAKSLQSCPTLCDPIDGSPPGSPVPGILQARTLEWVAISFSNEKWKWSRSVVSDSERPHGLQPTRLLRPWDSPGERTGVGCHRLLRVRTIALTIRTFVSKETTKGESLNPTRGSTPRSRPSGLKSLSVQASPPSDQPSQVLLASCQLSTQLKLSPNDSLVHVFQPPHNTALLINPSLCPVPGGPIRAGHQAPWHWPSALGSSHPDSLPATPMCPGRFIEQKGWPFQR